MTNEEAIAVFEEFKVIDDWTMVHLPPMEDAINKAIEALKVSEIPTGSELISRKDAIDVLAKFVPYAICDESTESYTNGLKDAYNLICQLPSAEPKTGEWITDIYKHGKERHVCSNCGRGHTEDSDYCPNCGADMRKEESEEDHDYERAIDQLEHDIAYEPTFNPEDGSM